MFYFFLLLIMNAPFIFLNDHLTITPQKRGPWEMLKPFVNESNSFLWQLIYTDGSSAVFEW